MSAQAAVTAKPRGAQRAMRFVLPVIVFAAGMLAWELLVRIKDIPPYVLPAPSVIVLTLIKDWAVLSQSLATTLLTTLEGFAAASIGGIALALLFNQSKWVEYSLFPYAVVLQVTPVIAIAPLVNIWAGTDHPGRAVVALAVVVAFFPIYSGALAGLKAVDHDLSRLFDLYGARPLQRLFRLQVPSAVPFVLQGHKVAAGLAIVGAVVAEFVAGSGKVQGLAWRIMDASFKLQTAKMFAALLVLGAMGVALYALLQLAERAGLKWWRGR